MNIHHNHCVKKWVDIICVFASSESYKVMGAKSVKEQVIRGGGSNEESERKGVSKTLEQLKEKLVREYPDLKSTNELDDLANKLSNKERLIEEYFSHLLKRKDDAIRMVEEEQEQFGEGYKNERTMEASKERIKVEIDNVRNLEVKLLLYEIRDQSLAQMAARIVHNRHDFTFGPFHAAVQIGDVFLEWGPSGLIIPKIVSTPMHEARADCRSPVLIANVHDINEEEQPALMSVPVRGGAEVTAEGFEKTVKTLEFLGQEKEQLINTIAEVVVLWNKKQHYGLFSNNCQHFVVDVLQSLGVTDHMDAFKGKLKEHASILIARDGAKKSITEFNSHQELDEHVRNNNIITMPRDDLEFIYCHYLLFHAWGRNLIMAKAWKCDEETCQCDRVYRCIENK